MRTLTYAQAIREAHAQLLDSDPRVFLIGQGLWSPWYAGSSMQDIDKEFGRDRVLDSPVSENATTGAAIGAAIAGLRPIVFHPRMDFMLLAVDPIVNQAANWSYMFAGEVSVPIVIRASINRGGQQAAQHSQALQAMFIHVPGLKVVMPSTPHDAKGLLIAALNDDNPVMYIEDRWLFDDTGSVPEDMYSVPIGKAEILREGKDVTIVANSYMTSQSLKAVKILARRGTDVELINLRSVKPWDKDLVCESVRKTGRLLVADGAWATAGLSAEISATVAERALNTLRAPIERVTLPDTPAPMSEQLEKVYYPQVEDILSKVNKLLGVTEHTAK